MPPISSTRQLVDKYIASSGQGSKLMLNMAPMNFGGLNAADKAAYAQLGHSMRCLFRDPLVNHSFVAPMVAVAGGGGWEAEWQLGEVLLRSDFTLSVREDISLGQRIWSWRLFVSNNTNNAKIGGDPSWKDVTSAAVASYTAGGGSDEDRAISIGFRRMFPVRGSNLTVWQPCSNYQQSNRCFAA
jgi:hypothetical protein